MTVDRFRSVALTGATGEMGERIAHYFSSRCDHLLVMGRNEEKLQRLKEAISKSHPRAQLTPAVVDVGDYESLRQAFTQYEGTLDQTDCLVNCAGITNFGTSLIEPGAFERMLRTNLMGPYHTMSLVLPGMKSRGQGHIINMISMSATRARPHMGGYAASQFGLRGFCEALRKELADTDIQISGICPGFVATSLTTDVVTDIPPQDMIQVDDIISTIDFILNMPHSVGIPGILLDCMSQVNRPEQV